MIEPSCTNLLLWKALRKPPVAHEQSNHDEHNHALQRCWGCKPNRFLSQAAQLSMDIRNSLCSPTVKLILTSIAEIAGGLYIMLPSGLHPWLLCTWIRFKKQVNNQIILSGLRNVVQMSFMLMPCPNVHHLYQMPFFMCTIATFIVFVALDLVVLGSLYAVASCEEAQCRTEGA